MNVIKELMERKGIQQKELAMSVGVSQPTVSDWVRNRKDPKGENLEKVAAFFKFSPLGSIEYQILDIKRPRHI